MTIKQVQTPKAQPKEEQQKPLLQITLPMSPDGTPGAPLSVGQHNACAQKNFKKVADLILAIINNQKLMGLAITDQDKKIKELQKSMKTISKNIREFIKENKNEPKTR